jgi:hypothetical protein
MADLVERQEVKDIFTELYGISAIGSVFGKYEWKDICETTANELPSIQPERKTGHWILNRSGAYCCDRCMEPCASYVMMKPRDKFCKMCGSRNEVME